MISDHQLRQYVLDELDFEPSIDATHVGVGVNSGVVTLTGFVSSYAEKADCRARVPRELSRLTEHPAPTARSGVSADVNATPAPARLAKTSGSAQAARPQERSAGRSRHD